MNAILWNRRNSTSYLASIMIQVSSCMCKICLSYLDAQSCQFVISYGMISACRKTLAFLRKLSVMMKDKSLFYVVLDATELRFVSLKFQKYVNGFKNNTITYDAGLSRRDDR